MQKLLIFGDSILRGITYDSTLGKHRLCENYKFPALCDAGFEIGNHARMGATVDRGYELLASRKDECEGALVLIEYGGNDCDFDWQAISDAPTAAHAPHTDETVFEETVEKAVATVRASGGLPFLSSLLPVDSQKYLEVITKGRDRDRILGWLGDVSMLYRYQEHYNRILEKVAQKTKTPLVDLRETFLLSHDYPELMSADGIHPTDKGHDRIEETILGALRAFA